MIVGYSISPSTVTLTANGSVSIQRNPLYMDRTTLLTGRVGASITGMFSKLGEFHIIVITIIGDSEDFNLTFAENDVYC